MTTAHVYLPLCVCVCILMEEEMMCVQHLLCFHDTISICPPIGFSTTTSDIIHKLYEGNAVLCLLGDGT